MKNCTECKGYGSCTRYTIYVAVIFNYSVVCRCCFSVPSQVLVFLYFSFPQSLSPPSLWRLSVICMRNAYFNWLYAHSPMDSKTIHIIQNLTFIDEFTLHTQRRQETLHIPYIHIIHTTQHTAQCTHCLFIVKYIQIQNPT